MDTLVHWVSQLPPFLPLSVIATMFLGAGAAVGLLLGRRHAFRGTTSDKDVKKILGVVHQLVDWTHGVADDMCEYRSVVSGVSQLFRNSGEPLGDQQRTATAGLLSHVVEANEQLQVRLNQAESMLKEQAGEIATCMSQARTDSLTGLPNRRALDEDLARQLAEWKRHGRSLSIMMIDIDHFKKFNDTYGHQAGDTVLQQVAGLLKKTMRESDLVGRFGGEEMAIVLPGTGAEEACLVAERARRAIQEASFTHEGQRLHVTVSVGAAMCQTGELVEELVNRADQALYAAKQAGRNRAFWHDGDRSLCIQDGRKSAAVDREQCSNEHVSATTPGRTTESFAEVCQDLRRRLEEVAGSSVSTSM